MTTLETALLLIICAAALAVLGPQRERTNRNPPPTYPRPPAPPAPPLMRPQGAKMTKQATPREVGSHEGLGAVLTYEDQGGDNAQRAAGEYLRALRASGRRIKSECVVTNEHSYSGPNVRAVVVGA